MSCYMNQGDKLNGFFLIISGAIIFSIVVNEIQSSVCDEKNPIRLWPGPYIYYQLSKNHTKVGQEVINRYVEMLNSVMSYRQFKQINRPMAKQQHVGVDDDEDSAANEKSCFLPYLYIDNEVESPFGCRIADRGWNGRARQVIHMTAKCYKEPQNVVRSLMRVLGLPPENNRGIRDTYVEVKWQNIETGSDVHFQIAPENESTRNYSYCTRSLLHYTNYDFSNGNGPTLIWKQNPEFKFVKDEMIPSCDVAKLQALYHNYNSIFFEHNKID